jgi:hypothetical protein
VTAKSTEIAAEILGYTNAVQSNAVLCNRQLISRVFNSDLYCPSPKVKREDERNCKDLELTTEKGI